MNTVFLHDLFRIAIDQPRQERLQRVSESWMNSIQFTKPHFSLKPVDKLLEDSIQK
jgi:hypothetical protein